jgi:hypothetical protein
MKTPGITECLPVPGGEAAGKPRGVAFSYRWVRTQIVMQGVTDYLP